MDREWEKLDRCSGKRRKFILVDKYIEYFLATLLYSTYNLSTLTLSKKNCTQRFLYFTCMIHVRTYQLSVSLQFVQLA